MLFTSAYREIRVKRCRHISEVRGANLGMCTDCPDCEFPSVREVEYVDTYLKYFYPPPPKFRRGILEEFASVDARRPQITSSLHRPGVCVRIQ